MTSSRRGDRRESLSRRSLLSGPTGQWPQMQLWKQDLAKAGCRWRMIWGQKECKLTGSNCVHFSSPEHAVSLVKQIWTFLPDRQMGELNISAQPFPQKCSPHKLMTEKRENALRKPDTGLPVHSLWKELRTTGALVLLSAPTKSLYLSGYCWWFRFWEVFLAIAWKRKVKEKKKAFKRGSTALLLVCFWTQISLCLLTALLYFFLPPLYLPHLPRVVISTDRSLGLMAASGCCCWEDLPVKSTQGSGGHHCCRVRLRHLWSTLTVPAARDTISAAWICFLWNWTAVKRVIQMPFPSPQVFSQTSCEGQNCRTVRYFNRPIKLQEQSGLLNYRKHIPSFFLLPQDVEKSR